MFGTKIMKIFYQCKETAILVMYMVYINTITPLWSSTEGLFIIGRECLLLSHDVENAYEVCNVNSAVTIYITNDIVASFCHDVENTHSISNVNVAITVYITQDAKSAQSSVIATLYLPLEQRPAQTDGSILVPIDVYRYCRRSV